MEQLKETKHSVILSSASRTECLGKLTSDISEWHCVKWLDLQLALKEEAKNRGLAGFPSVVYQNPQGENSQCCLDVRSSASSPAFFPLFCYRALYYFPGKNKNKQKTNKNILAMKIPSAGKVPRTQVSIPEFPAAWFSRLFSFQDCCCMGLYSVTAEILEVSFEGWDGFMSKYIIFGPLNEI